MSAAGAAGPDMSGSLVAVVQAMALVAGAGDALEAAIKHGLALISDACGVDVAFVSRGVVASPGDTVLRPALADDGLRIGADPVPPALGTALMAFADGVFAARRRAADAQACVLAAEARLGRRNALMRSLFDVSPVGILLVEADSGRVIEANDAFLKFGAWPWASVVGHDIFQLVPAEQQNVLAGALAELAKASRFGPVEHAFDRPDGSLLHAVVRGIMLESGIGRKIIWFLVEDVSQAHAHLAELRAARDGALRAQDQLHTAVRTLPFGFMLFDAEDRLIIVNDNMREIYPELAPALDQGLTYGRLFRMGIDLGLFPEALGREEAYAAEIMRQRTKPADDRLVRLQGGRLIRVLDRETPDGGRVGLRIDITDQDEVARRLGDVIAGSQAGTWEVDLVTGENVVNDRWFEMLGFTREDIGQISTDLRASLIHPDDRDRVLHSMERMIGGEIVQYEHSYRMGGAGGRWVWITDRGRISAWSPGGRPIRMAGVHFDISAMKEAEERLEQIIQGAEAGTWQYDVLTGDNRVNERWAEIIGYTRAELGPITPALWRSLVHPGDLDKVHVDLEKSFAVGDWFFNQELRLRHKAGHWVWVQSRGQVTAWDDKKLPRLLSGIHLDISARKQLEDDLKAERDFLVTLTETSVSGIVALDRDARIVFLNPEAVAILEAPAEVLIGQVCDLVLLGMTDEQGGAMTLPDMPYRQALASGCTQRDTRLRLAMPDGRIKVVSINAATLPETGIEARVVCTITDITASAEAEDSLRRATDRAEAANRAKSQFLANMSHELRTPLNGVLGMADLLIDGQDAGQTRAMAQTIRESGNHLLSILNDILDLAKIESGKLTLADEVCAIPDLARRVAAMHTRDAEAKGVVFGLHLGPGLQTPRRGDPQRLMQVMHNLVGNAIKFTEQGAVDLQLDAVGDDLSLVVQDTGIGMTEEQAVMVFDEFVQADGSITRRFGGTGLGLPIVRRLVQLMGGEITLKTVWDAGTEVTVRLPLPLATGAGAPDAAATRADFTGLRVLVAEDNATNRMILRAMLGRLGIVATMVDDGDAAVLAFGQGEFDLLLLDISMPRKDGVTALAEMRSQPGHLPPAIAVTANAMTHLVESYHAAGFDEVVAKPVRLAALAEAILRVCPVAASGTASDHVTPAAGSHPSQTG